MPAVFDKDRSEWTAVRAELRQLLGEDGYASARRTTINAHYTDPAVVAAIWRPSASSGSTAAGCSSPAAAPACSSDWRPPAPS